MNVTDTDNAVSSDLGTSEGFRSVLLPWPLAYMYIEIYCYNDKREEEKGPGYAFP
jgi:hypothetical protein